MQPSPFFLWPNGIDIELLFLLAPHRDIGLSRVITYSHRTPFPCGHIVPGVLCKPEKLGVISGVSLPANGVGVSQCSGCVFTRWTYGRASAPEDFSGFYDRFRCGPTLPLDKISASVLSTQAASSASTKTIRGRQTDCSQTSTWPLKDHRVWPNCSCGLLLLPPLCPASFLCGSNAGDRGGGQFASPLGSYRYDLLTFSFSPSSTLRGSNSSTRGDGKAAFATAAPACSI